MTQLIGYARVSTKDQELLLQKDALEKAGCIRIFEEKISGTKSDRPALNALLEYARSGDTIVVWKLDRLGRSLKDLLSIVTTLQERKIGFKSLQENFDTTTSGGKLIFHVFAAIAEFEKDIIKERTVAGLNAARARGRKGGRPKKLSDNDVEMIKKLHQDKTIPIKDILSRFNISKSTLYEAI